MNLAKRIVLESIHKKPSNIIEISLDTGLSNRAVVNILESLEADNLISFKKCLYHLNKENFFKINSLLSDDKNFECKDLTDGIISDQLFHSPSDSNLCIKKVFMTEEDHKIYNALLYNVTSFLENLRKDQKNKKFATKEQRVVFIGSAIYEDVLRSYFKTI